MPIKRRDFLKTTRALGTTAARKTVASFLIENGKITKALKNFRWNESPLSC